MAIPIIRQEDLQQFNTELLEDIKDLFHVKTNDHKLSLRTSGFKKLLSISLGTLQYLRINKTIYYSRGGGTLYCNHGDLGNCLQTLNI